MQTLRPTPQKKATEEIILNSKYYHSVFDKIYCIMERLDFYLFQYNTSDPFVWTDQR